jgi:hypothetical protein
VTVLAPLDGSPEGVLAVADALATGAARLDAVRSVLAGMRADAGWEGEAGRALGRSVGSVPPVLDAVVQRYAGAAAALRGFADVLADAQRVTTAAVRVAEEAEAAYAVLEDRAYALLSAGGTEADPSVVAVRRLQTEQLGRQQEAARLHAGALDRYREGDRTCAARLRALAEDSLVDPATYRALATASDLGAGAAELGALGLVVTPLKPVAAVGGAVATAADAALLVGYGDGSWRELATSAVLTSLGFGGRALRAGATAGATTVDGRAVGRAMSFPDRLRAGARTVAEEERTALAAPWRSTPALDDEAAGLAALGSAGPAGLTVASGGARAGAGLSAAARARAVLAAAPGRARQAAQARVDKAVLDDWRLATAGGADARRMYVGGASLTAASKVGGRVADRVPPDREEADPDLSLGACPPSPVEPPAAAPPTPR